MRIRTVTVLALKNLQHAWYKVTGNEDRIIPYKIVVELTTQCNSKCLYCDIWQIKKENLKKIDLNDFERFLKKMDRNLLWLALTGGEISTNNQFPEIVRLIKENCPNLQIITFTTNGLLPQRILEYALLLKNNLSSDLFITISLDGDEATHDTIRGIKGNYAKCMETHQLLKESGINAHFGITVAEGNTSFIKKSFKEYREKIKAVTIFHTGGIFLTDLHSTERIDADITESLKTIYRNYKVSSLGEWLVKLYIKAGVVFMQKKRQTNVIPCDVGRSSAHLMANGDLLPCMYLEPIKRIGEGFELTDYHSLKAKEMLEEIKRDKCPHCWMSCYGPHNILQAPLKSLSVLVKPL